MRNEIKLSISNHRTHPSLVETLINFTHSSNHHLHRSWNQLRSKFLSYLEISSERRNARTFQIPRHRMHD